jgi:hypothetical protein
MLWRMYIDILLMHYSSSRLLSDSAGNQLLTQTIPRLAVSESANITSLHIEKSTLSVNIWRHSLMLIEDELFTDKRALWAKASASAP